MMSSPGMTLLVESHEFWTALRQDIAGATASVYIQTFALEGDAVGNALGDVLLGLQAIDVKIMVDSFAKFIINDKLIYAPRNLRDRQLQQEVRDTAVLIEKLTQGGIALKYINPTGPLFAQALVRNHKKVVLIDGRIAYIGGINFCEHNFAWHDLMVRVESRDVVQLLEYDFVETWQGRKVSAIKQFEGLGLHILDGLSNRHSVNTLVALLDGAKQHIFVESPYLTFPIIDALHAARQRGVLVTVIAPQTNNWKLARPYITGEAARADFRLMFYAKGMSHLKAILIDQDCLILGSSNFDLLSLSLHQECLAIITTPHVIASFRERVMLADLKHSSPYDEVGRGFQTSATTWVLRLWLHLVVKLAWVLHSFTRLSAHGLRGGGLGGYRWGEFFDRLGFLLLGRKKTQAPGEPRVIEYE